jgi:peptidoglycan/xylan/chitin deacetylase (PgdA/CDA1 family)
MYHMIGGSEDRFTVSPARLRSHLDTLRLRGYRLVTFREYAAGKYAAYAARAPPVAVITFDDSTRCQFNMLPDGKIDPDSAVGVLEEYKERHPEYPVTATFFVNTTTLNRTVAFEQEGLEGRKLRFLVQHGYEVGAHGDRHRSFRSLAPDEIRADLDIFSRRMQEYLPEYTIKSFAYPFGSIPDARRQRVVQEYFPYTAHAWGGIAHGQYLNAPRIETGPATILAQYLSPTARLRSAMGNVYKGEQNLMSYARSHP